MSTLVYWIALQLAVTSTTALPASLLPPLVVQDATSKTITNDIVTRVYSAGDIGSDEAERVIRSLGINANVVSTSATQHVVVRGTAEAQQQVTELLAQLREASKSSAPEEGSKSVMQIYALKHTPAAEVAAMLIDVLVRPATVNPTGNPSPSSIVPDIRTNSLLVSASLETHRRIRELLSQLDQPQQEQTSSTRTLLYTPQYRSAEDLKFLATSQVSPTGHLAVSRELNTIVVRDQTAVVEQIQSLFRSLDVDPEPIQLEWWVLGPAGDKASRSSLEESLPGIMPALSQMKLQDYAIMSRAAVQSLASSTFNVSQASSNSTLAVGQPTIPSISVNGDVRLLEQGQVAMVRLNCELALVTQDDESTRPRNSLFRLDTTLKVRRNTLVVVGLSPASSASEKPLVLVLRVD